MSAVLRADSLYRFYHAGDDETLALQGVSLGVQAGEVVAVTGPSGSGKSTLLACLAGLDEPDGGMVTLDGERLSRRPEEHRAALRARKLGMLYQHANLVGHLSVEQNVALAQRLGDAPRDDRRRRANEREGGGHGAMGPRHDLRATLLEQCGIAARAAARPSQLSGGELARAGLAVALANDPPVLLADEPTGELDDATAQRVLALLRERADGGTAVLIVTHDPEVAAAADREIRLRDGRVEDGAAS
ncbi:MAG: putative transport system ATP-binding protein [Solirubrobacteraceae bacterium]|jgi:putative ABC transport system ATP-binding protein|nr:putative transport system ATP-binding protein [Solirubrobacteraceae bacterium]